MNTPVKILLSLLLLGGLAVGIAIVVNSDDNYTNETNVEGGTGNEEEQPEKPGKTLEGKGKAEERQPQPEKPKRVELVRDDTGKEYPQGVLGRVLDAQGFPIAECEVYLMPSTQSEDVLEMMRQVDQGRRFLPAAQGRTNPQGRFQLGISKINPKRRYDIKILSKNHCDHTVPNISVQKDDKYDAGDIRLKRGIVVFGRVTVQGRNLPAAEAVVSLENPQGRVEVAPPPGRENGLSISIDQFGNYRMANVDPAGQFKIAAWAPGFARVEKENLELDPNKENRVDFELPIGHKIGGVVTGPAGKPIPKAKITAYALSQKTQQTVESTTDENGRFELKGLHQGAFSVIARAEGFIENKEEPVVTGKQDVHLVLENQGRVDLQVFGKSGTPLSSYRIVLKTYVPGQGENEEFYGNTGLEKNVRGAKQGRTSLTGINPMDYVLEVHAKGHAKAFSEPFKIVAGGTPVPNVTVRMTEGGVIAGVLVDMRNKPVAGATVATLPKGFVENPLTRMFNIPFKITKTTVKSNAKGEFRIPMLNDGRYQLKVTHPQYCAHHVSEVQVAIGQTANVAQIQMTRGVLISGTTRVDGVPKGQVKVMISAVGGDPGTMPVSSEAISDNKGNFVMPKRMPPGNYEARAGEQIQGNPFILMFQMQKSKKDFTLTARQETLTLHMAVERVK